ncbi:hypothetical protein HMSSN139_46870 [Paenibacillus sp. HMSSN-139]|nr:hypothetical protein HMSSN139_46870 [Paenibacillus sp. HMSSN-139]
MEQPHPDLDAAEAPAGQILNLPPQADLGDSLIGVKDVITDDFIYVINYNYVLQQKLVYKVPVKALLQQQNEIKRIIQLISIAYFAVGLVLILYFWRSLMTPIQKLVYFVRRYEPGNVVPETRAAVAMTRSAC